jgi:hypothetical protein
MSVIIIFLRNINISGRPLVRFYIDSGGGALYKKKTRQRRDHLPSH